jgi:hypothetical protein
MNTGAADQGVLLDKQHSAAKLGGLDRAALSRRTAANDDQVKYIHNILWGLAAAISINSIGMPLQQRHGIDR